MRQKYSLLFHETQQPITQPVTKFGGQPIWLHAPQWPFSQATGKPMRFICQIALDSALFGEIPARMAYLFISDGRTFVDNTFDPDGGEREGMVDPAINRAIHCRPITSNWFTFCCKGT